MGITTEEKAIDHLGQEIFIGDTLTFGHSGNDPVPGIGVVKSVRKSRVFFEKYISVYSISYKYPCSCIKIGNKTVFDTVEQSIKNPNREVIYN